MKKLLLTTSHLIPILLICLHAANALPVNMNLESWTKLTLPEDHYVNIAQISTDYGEGISVNTIEYPGAFEYGYKFCAYSDEVFVVPLSGVIEVTGYFMYNDITPHLDRKHLALYLLQPDLSDIIKTTRVLNYLSGDTPGTWYYRRVIVSNLTSGEEFRIAFGRTDNCDMERQLEASWAAIDIFLGRKLMVPSDYLTIQEAINEALVGDTIEVAPNTYYEHLTVDKNNLTIIGSNCETTIVDADMDSGSNLTAVSILNDYVVFKGFTVCNCPNGSGIAVYGQHVTLDENEVTNNSIGISLYANDNKIVKTSIFNNTNGIWMKSDINNTEISYNNFYNNTQHCIILQPSEVNSWDNGYLGNFWSNYTGTDLNGDGIGEDPFEIAVNNTDHYPLMNPYWNVADVNHDLKVDIFDIVKVCSSYGASPLDPDWSYHADIMEPYGLIDIFDVVACVAQYGQRYQ